MLENVPVQYISMAILIANVLSLWVGMAALAVAILSYFKSKRG